MSGPIFAERFGDFLEIVGADASGAADALGIACVTNSKTGEPMCGIPMHSAYRWLPIIATAMGRPVKMVANGQAYGDDTFEPGPAA